MARTAEAGAADDGGVARTAAAEADCGDRARTADGDRARTVGGDRARTKGGGRRRRTATKGREEDAGLGDRGGRQRRRAAAAGARRQ